MKNAGKIKTPIVLIIFNRPDATEKVFNEIAKVQPPKLLVVADGPREGNLDDLEKCKKTREIIKKVDWPCEVLTNYSDVNLGCKMRPVTGLNWAFGLIDEAIILEDDCVPDTTFFRFCEELLEKYRNDKRVAIISGTNLFVGKIKNPYSYYYSIFPQTWGWATWKRSWENYDIGVKKWADLKNTDWLEKKLGAKSILYNYWKNVFDDCYQQKLNAWDYQITFSAWVDGSLAVIPKINLVSNIGFGKNKGTNIIKRHKYAALKTSQMQFPLVSPEQILENKKIDKSIGKYTFTYYRPFLIKAFLYFWLKIKRFFLGL